MNLNEFNEFYLNNINLNNEFLDALSSHGFLPHILQPARVRGNSKTLIDNFQM